MGLIFMIKIFIQGICNVVTIISYTYDMIASYLRKAWIFQKRGLGRLVRLWNSFVTNTCCTKYTIIFSLISSKYTSISRHSNSWWLSCQQVDLHRELTAPLAVLTRKYSFYQTRVKRVNDELKHSLTHWNLDGIRLLFIVEFVSRT